MGTTKLYQNDTYLKEWDAEITSVREEKGSYIITLDRTAFFPEGGGQSCDTGVVGAFRVTDVQEEGDQVYHRIAFQTPSDEEKPEPPAAPPAAPKEGERVHCILDWDRRFDNMQRHCGEHILSGVFYSMFGGVNRGFHMGADYMTIDVSLEENPEITKITDADALAAELAANRVIWSDAPVTVTRFESREEAEKMPLRKALALDEDISIVSVGSPEHAADCVACCGTHPSSAGQVGLVKILKVENYKGMFRIYCEAGRRALKDYDNKHNILTHLSNRYSSSIADFPDKLKIQEERISALKNELFHIKKAFIDKECAALDAVLQSTPDRVVAHPLPALSMDDVFAMGKRYMGNTKKLIMLYSEKDASYILVSDGEINCGALVKEYASFYKGKGGGSKVSARAIFPDKENADLFADLIRKHLR